MFVFLLLPTRNTNIVTRSFLRTNGEQDRQVEASLLIRSRSFRNSRPVVLQWNDTSGSDTEKLFTTFNFKSVCGKGEGGKNTFVVEESKKKKKKKCGKSKKRKKKKGKGGGGGGGGGNYFYFFLIKKKNFFYFKNLWGEMGRGKKYFFC